MRLAISLFIAAAPLLAGSPADPAVAKAINLYKRTNYTACIATLKQATPDAKTLELLGQCHFMQGEYKRATDVLEQAAALEPNNSMIQTWLGRAYGRRAETSFPVAALGLAKKTREILEKAVDLDKHNGEAVNDLFEFYVQAPPLVGGGIDKARNLLPLIAAIDPIEIHFARARIAEERKLFPEAESYYRKALAAAPGQSGRILDLASFLAKHGNHDEADKLFDKAATQHPTAAKVLFDRAKSNIRTQYKTDDAQEYLRKYLAATDLTPDDPSKSEAQKLLKKVSEK